MSIVIALVCVVAGTWQIARFDWKRNANHHLRSDDHAAVTPIGQALGPAAASTATGKTEEFRQVSAVGRYLDGHEVLVRGQNAGDEVGYLVLTPFQTSQGVLLVARGFISQTQGAAITPTAPAAPTSTVTITARLRPASTRADRLGSLPANQVLSVNINDQQARLGQPVWNGYGELLGGQPGSDNLTTLPGPDLSNPAGGAEVPQHAAYVVQWYLFAGLALALPFVLAAAERRRDLTEERTGPDDPARVAVHEPSAANPAMAGPAMSHPAAEPAKSKKAKKASLDDRLAGNV